MHIGVDIGGTFTDVVCEDPENGRVFFTKVLTNYSNIVQGVIHGLHELVKRDRLSASDMTRIVHGTTIATNVIVQRRGAPLGLLTTEGFEDVLEIGRLNRREMYNLDIDVQTPVFLCSRRNRVGVPERTDAAGQIIKLVDEEFVARETEAMRRRGIEVIAVVYLFSFKNPQNEQRTREVIKSVCPDMYVSLSSEVDPLYREYERTVVTAFDAYMRPPVERFMTELEAQLRRAGFAAEVHIMQSRGGVTSARAASSRPVNLFLSGPAGGVAGAIEVAQRSGIENLITIDIGGTSCDAALIVDRRPALTTAGDIAGYPVRVPMIDIHTIGAGGGSVIYIDSTGGLRVGPRSAGSDPGPACYGRGGTEPTLTDASLLLGYLGTGSFAGGALDLDIDAAERSLHGVASRLGLSAIELSLGAHRIANVHIGDQIRRLTIKRGYDPRHFSMLAFGGAGPIHAGALTSMLHIPTCVVPQMPGVLSAYGLLHANLELEKAVSFLHPLSTIDVDTLAAKYAELAQACLAAMAQERFDMHDLELALSADLRYLGQSFEITVPLRQRQIDARALADLLIDYETTYRKTYGYYYRSEVEIVNLRVVAFRRFGQGVPIPAHKPTQDVVFDTRLAWFAGVTEPVSTRVYRRPDLGRGHTIDGPAIVEQADATVVVYPSQRASTDSADNLIITGISEAYTR